MATYRYDNKPFATLARPSQPMSCCAESGSRNPSAPSGPSVTDPRQSDGHGRFAGSPSEPVDPDAFAAPLTVAKDPLARRVLE
jgi:hypothetical protein